MTKAKNLHKDKQLEAVKRAIMMEIHGLRFYEVAAERCSSKAAKEMFSDMAQDEVRHREELERQFKALLGQGKWRPPRGAKQPSLRFKDPVIDASLKKDVEGAWFDSAAVHIGILLEKGALQYYGRQERAAQDPRVKAVFHWLAQWEQGHLHRLMALERSMREEIWNNAQFWPLD